MRNGKFWVAVFSLLILAAGFRISVAHWLPNDAPDDGRVYAQIARNVLEKHVYSHDTEVPFGPSLIRLPGYPLFLAAIYSIFGHTNNGAVRVVQALVDTATCVLIGLLAWYWQPNEKRKRRSAIAALALAVVCPFTTIYAATILAEVPTFFWVIAMFLAATIAFRNGDDDQNTNFKRAIRWWCLTGLLGGLAVLFRPDNGLFVAAVGITLAVTGGFWSAVTSAARRRFGLSNISDGAEQKRRRRYDHPSAAAALGTPVALPAHSKVRHTFVAGAIFSLAFAVVLTPWTVRNWRVFHLFQPLAPAHAEMPGEFVPRGYNLWLRTWIDDDSYIQPFLWSLDTEPIDIDEIPPSAFDSPQEKDRVAALLDKYNHADENNPDDQQDTNDDQNSEPSDEAEPEEDQANETAVEMTPEIDAGFAQLARERIARHRFRYYVWLPIKRARAMWFDTHSQYWPFEGTLLPLEDLDYEHQQHLWLPLFAGLTAIYTLLGLAGGWVLLRARKLDARRWLLLVTLAIFLRLVLFSSLENPEPRYLVEFFPFLSILGGIAIGRISWSKARRAEVK
jgi:Dolichyl-phosphate-mannose-protein mannosyltransferase